MTEIRFNLGQSKVNCFRLFASENEQHYNNRLGQSRRNVVNCVREIHSSKLFFHLTTCPLMCIGALLYHRRPPLETLRTLGPHTALFLHNILKLQMLNGCRPEHSCAFSSKKNNILVWMAGVRLFFNSYPIRHVVY